MIRRDWSSAVCSPVLKTFAVVAKKESAPGEPRHKRTADTRTFPRVWTPWTSQQPPKEVGSRQGRCRERRSPKPSRPSVTSTRRPQQAVRAHERPAAEYHEPK